LTDTTNDTRDGVRRVAVGTLAMMVVAGMVGAGVFSLPRRFATETGVWGALIASGGEAG
jgi:arginine:ornithine antiporter/lysine permease